MKKFKVKFYYSIHDFDYEFDRSFKCLIDAIRYAEMVRLTVFGFYKYEIVKNCEIITETYDTGFTLQSMR